MSYAAVITVVVNLPEAHNDIEAELYGKNYADRFLESAEDCLIECKFEKTLYYEVDE